MEATRFAVNQIIIPMYIDTAKTFMNLSAGALALSITFREKILGQTPGTRVGIVMIFSWICFLIAIGASALYQYVGVKFLDQQSPSPGKVQFLKILIDNPGWVYGAMFLFFYLGAIFLVVAATHHLHLVRGR